MRALVLVVVVLASGCDARDKQLDVERLTLVREIKDLERQRDAVLAHRVEILVKRAAAPGSVLAMTPIDVVESDFGITKEIEDINRRSSPLRARLADIELVQPAPPAQ